MKTIFLLAIISISLFFNTSSWADSPVIGYVKTVTGKVYIVSGGNSTPAIAGTPLHTGDHITTTAGAALGLTLKDNTLMSIGPDTHLSLDDYAYAPTKNNLKFSTTISSGTLHFISGAIAKMKPESVSIRTPTGTIGIRGTRFVVKVAS